MRIEDNVDNWQMATNFTAFLPPKLCQANFTASERLATYAKSASLPLTTSHQNLGSEMDYSSSAIPEAPLRTKVSQMETYIRRSKMRPQRSPHLPLDESLRPRVGCKFKF